MHWKRLLFLAFFCIATALYFTSWGVYASLYFGVNFPRRFPALWVALQLSIFVGYLPLFVPYKPAFSGPAAYVEEHPLAGPLALILCLPALLLVVPNFIYWDDALRNGYPEVIAGKFYMHFPRGDVLRQVSAEDFERFELYHARKFSGHWMACHIFAMAALYERLTDRWRVKAVEPLRSSKNRPRT